MEIYHLEQDIGHLKGDYFVQAVVVANDPKQALEMVKKELGYWNEDEERWLNEEEILNWNEDEKLLVLEDEHVTVRLVGTAVPGYREPSILAMEVGADHDL